jgi:Zn-dependent protease with chaperone function
MTDVEITQLLQQAFANDDLPLQVKQQGSEVLVMINRPSDMEDLDYEVLVEWFTAAVVALPDSQHFTLLKLFSRIKGAAKPDWQTKVDLTQLKKQTSPSTYIVDHPQQEHSPVTYVLDHPQKESSPLASMVKQEDKTDEDETGVLHEEEVTGVSEVNPVESTVNQHKNGHQDPVQSPILSGSLDLTQYRFIRNDLLIRTSLPKPNDEVIQAVYRFADLIEADKRQVLPLLEAFFKSPVSTDLSQLTAAPKQWLEGLQQMNEKKLKDVAIWLTRYCVNPEKTVDEFGGKTTLKKGTVAPANPSYQPSSYQPSVSSSVKAAASSPESSFPDKATPPKTAGRSTQTLVPLKVATAAGNLVVASGVTLSLLFGMVFILMLNLAHELKAASVQFDPFTNVNVPIDDAIALNSGIDWTFLGIGIILTIGFNLGMFLISPWIMDIVQGWLYGVDWVSLTQIERSSPESAVVIRRVCAKYKIPEPKLGLIRDQNPTAFTYGSFPATARLVVSEGLFTYLTDEEVATVYAHELGHIVHWDFAVMTLASTLVQITYLIYSSINDNIKGDNNFAKGLRNIGFMAYVFYRAGTYLLLFLSRVREYYADHFAAEVTGNPNALSRALVKIAYGIVEVAELEFSQGSRKPSRLLEGTRALGIYDAKSAPSTATAYRISSDTEQLGKVFLWDIFNPWAWWMEWGSTHPLTGKRVRALTTYAEQLGLDTEFNMGKIIAQGNTLDRKRLYQGFGLDILLMNAPFIGFLAGLAISFTAWGLDSHRVFTIPLGSIILGVGLGILIKTAVMFPSLKRGAPPTTVLKAMSNPYASPLRGIPLELEGKIIGRGDAGNVFGSDMKFQDPTGLIFLKYASRFGALGNFFFGAGKVDQLIGQESRAIGWFRRGVAPWVDLAAIHTQRGEHVTSHHPFWGNVLGVLGILVGIGLLAL